MNYNSLTIVFAGGGTLGHLFPGLAVAAEIKRLAPAARICFAGCGKEALHRQVLLAGHEYIPIACRPGPQGMLDSLRFVATNARGLRKAVRYLRSQRVDAVVGLGGYASFPMSRAAALCGVPLVLLEQNAIPGRTTRRLAPHAQLICVAFDEARSQLNASGPIRTTGNPVRQVAHQEQRSTDVRRLLILGGSQGSQSLNAVVPQALARLVPELSGWTILHQAGETEAAATSKRYAQLGVKVHVTPFIENLPRVMAHAHLAISRSGGTTLAELASSGLPALLVPYPAASDNHQRRNAQVFATAGASRVCEARHGPQSLQSQLVTELPELLIDATLRDRMSQSMRQLARPAAAWHVAQMILDQAVGLQRKRLAA